MKIVFATNNPNKLKEVQSLLPKSIELLSLKDIGCFDDIEETAITLIGNAKIKADFITEKYGYDCFADDTGLIVTSLDGAPGVYSARYAGKNATSENNMDKLIFELKSKSDRSAYFKTVVALNLNNKKFIFEGDCQGEILKNKSGTSGFGYDPIFKPNGFETTFAEMTIKEKGKISHRGKAIKKLTEFLSTL